MSETIKLNMLDEQVIEKWYERIRPIVLFGGKPFFMRQLTPHELSGVSYLWLNDMNDYDTEVNLADYSVLADVKMLHRYGFYGFFKPSVAEIISQIPEELLPEVVAFQIIYSPDTCDDLNLFKKEVDAHYHVSVVRLYKKKGEKDTPAELLSEYPTSDSTLPIGMSPEKFEQLKRR
ncbi:MAG: hypothetical protein IKK43_01465 [Clostridia bacterium]|nr:hypothetical protein [Clostridia bacterium]